MQINFSIDNFSVEGNSFFNKCERKQEIKLEFFLHHVEKDTDTPIHYIICTKNNWKLYANNNTWGVSEIIKKVIDKENENIVVVLRKRKSNIEKSK